jgi:Na+-driven multidrug efflux pump
VLSIVRAFVVWVPLAWIGASLFGPDAIWWAAVAANLVAGLLGASWFESTLGRMIAVRGVPSPGAGAVESREAAEPAS